MKIALIVHDLNEQGGHSRYTRILADQLAPRHEVTVFANRCERPDDARWSFRFVPAWRGGALSTVRTFPLGLSVHAGALATFDICHSQGYCGGRPNVVTAHICVRAYLDSLQNASRRTRASLELMAKAEARFYRNYSGEVIAISQKIARELRECYQPRANVRVIPHGVDNERFSPANRDLYRGSVRRELGLRDDETCALYVGDLTKAHTHLQRLADCARDIRFAIVTRSLRYRWSAANVIFLPPTTAIERYYAAADAFVFPTTYDAFGMTALEAMASGLPVFISDRAGASELVEHGKDGFAIPLDDWVSETATNLRDNRLLRQLGQRAVAKARCHDWSSVVEAIEQIYFFAVGNARIPQTEGSQSTPEFRRYHHNAGL
jgi:UDP-glucose:(heptosyl)LPS alpha-1,3-glucosyltransferase